MAHVLHMLQGHHPVCQQAQAPLPVALRRVAAAQGDQSGLCASVQQLFPQGLPLLAVKGRVKTLLHEAAAKPLNSGDAP